MSLNIFYCNAGRNLIKISIDFWQDFKDFVNQYEGFKKYRIIYKNFDTENIYLSHSNALNDFLNVQLEVLNLIIQNIEENLDQHETLISLKSSLSEFAIIKHLLSGSRDKRAIDYLKFINDQIVPIFNIKIQNLETSLKIKHHKSYVRKKIEEFGEIKLLNNIIPSEVLEKITCYFDKLIPDKYQRAHFYQEIFDGRTNELIYDINLKDTKSVCEFFKFLHGNGYLTAEKAAIAKWMSRKFQRVDNGKQIGTVETLKRYLNGHHDRQFLNKFLS